jgi:O-antigen ligase
MGFFLISVVIAAVLMPEVRIRIFAVWVDLQSYMYGSNPHTSTGLRFQMWEAGIQMWIEHPWIGTGLGDYSVHLRQMMETGRSLINEHFGEAHNLYIEFLATTGAIGASLCVSFLFIQPLRIALKIRTLNKDGLVASVFVILTVSAFMIFGLTQNWLGRSSIASSYVIFVAVILATSHKKMSPH